MDVISTHIQPDTISLSSFFSAVELAFNYTHLLIDFERPALTDVLSAGLSQLAG